MTLDLQKLAMQVAEPQKYHVLMMTAVVVSVTAQSEVEAASRALSEAPATLDAERMQWVVKFVSDKEIAIEDPEMTDAIRQSLGQSLEGTDGVA